MINNPVFFQRIEGAAIFATATFTYFNQSFDSLVYVLLLFAFDVSMLGYLANPKVGAYLYNIVHSLVAPSLLIVLFIINDSQLVLGTALLWFAHIGMDRALGYGLKFTTGFKHTHLGDIGK
jgi:hypothetical protein